MVIRNEYGLDDEICNHLRRHKDDFGGYKYIHDLGHRVDWELPKVYLCSLTNKPCVTRIETEDRVEKFTGDNKWYKVKVDIEKQERCPAYEPSKKSS